MAPLAAFFIHPVSESTLLGESLNLAEKLRDERDVRGFELVYIRIYTI
jgi:hypothetical protein